MKHKKNRRSGGPVALGVFQAAVTVARQGLAMERLYLSVWRRLEASGIRVDDMRTGTTLDTIAQNIEGRVAFLAQLERDTALPLDQGTVVSAPSAQFPGSALPEHTPAPRRLVAEIRE